MNKIKILFFIIFCLIFLISLVFLNSFQTSFYPKIEKITEFQLIRMSGNGSIYQNPEMTDPFPIKKIKNTGEIYIKADAKTAFEFFFVETFFTMSPGSSLFFNPRTRELFLNGDFFWHKEVKKKIIDINITSEDTIKDLYNPEILQPIEQKNQNINIKLLLSESGRIKEEDEVLKIWNYSGKLVFRIGNESYDLNSNQMLNFNKKSKLISFFEILPAPEFINPEKKTIHLNSLDESIIKFGWKNVTGANEYILRLYSSALRENQILEKYLTANRKSIDILRFENENEIFWEVYPYDSIKKIEGVPSSMGEIKIFGVILDKEKLLKPPKLEINSLTVSGNMVIIKGETDANSQLFINDEYVKIDMDGKFIHTITFKTIGTQSIVFKLISPSEIETINERQVAIFEE